MSSPPPPPPSESPPPPAQPAQNQITVTAEIGADYACLVFSDGWKYQFESPQLLRTALSYRGAQRGGARPNQELAILGDNVARYILGRGWYFRKESIWTWNSKHGGGVAMNAFLAWQANNTGLVKVMRDFLDDGSSNGITETEVATTMEAIFGAVDWDSESNLFEVKEVMAHPGMYWPHGDAGEFQAMLRRFHVQQPTKALGRKRPWWKR
ncbi:Putative ribonuclease III, endonuclease domain superfamily [Septoria linicola]|uniref:Ribonuclease III, endonuclease domain superfamily n=1 Tax=Septoria linicola TaxID=215465 RepID=A0A9Q9AGE6_9PEZI|nr:Putative ribonuclease III, endonuclease domain superfamily [Septoria linicola]